jgi:hypothetical protein
MSCCGIGTRLWSVDDYVRQSICKREGLVRHKVSKEMHDDVLYISREIFILYATSE